MSGLFDSLSGMIVASPHIALAASFAWGVLSVVLSPCHLASIPLVVGFINGQGRIGTMRAFLLSLLFSSGILVTIGIIGLITGIAGRMLGDIGGWAKYLVAILLIITGLHLVGLIRVPMFESGGSAEGFRRKGYAAAFVLGLVFGISLGPCTFAFMAPMLGVVFSVALDDIVFAVSLILAYAAGHCLVIVLAGTFTGAVQRYLDWNERSDGSILLRRICGVLVILGGLYLLLGRQG